MSAGTMPLVVHVVHGFSVGGLENGVVNLINRSTEWRHAVVSLTTIDPRFASRITRKDVHFEELRKQPGSGLRLFPRLHRLYKQMAPAVVHTRNLAGLDAAVPAWAAGVPARIHGEHGWDVGDEEGASRRYSLVRRAYRPFIHHYVALSRHIGRYLTQRVGVPGSRIEHICNGVDTIRFTPATAGRQPIEGSPFNDPRLWIVGTVGRLQAVKDQPTLVRAFAHALNAGGAEATRRLRLVVAGDGPLRGESEALAHDLGVADFVWFAGERHDVPELFRGFDCFALPSRTEGISNTILEAMASGLPVVATRVGGTPEIVEEWVNATLVPPASPIPLGAALHDYFRNPEVARRHGRAGRALAVQRLSLDRMVGQYTALYKTLIEGRGATLVRSAVAGEKH